MSGNGQAALPAQYWCLASEERPRLKDTSFPEKVVESRLKGRRDGAQCRQPCSDWRPDEEIATSNVGALMHKQIVSRGNVTVEVAATSRDDADLSAEMVQAFANSVALYVSTATAWLVRVQQMGDVALAGVMQKYFRSATAADLMKVRGVLLSTQQGIARACPHFCVRGA
jgi:hypothetical protein